MANLRINRFLATDSRSFRVEFTDSINPNIGAANIEIESNDTGVATPVIQSTRINGSILYVTTTPMVPMAAYFVTLKSVAGAPFSNFNGTEFLYEDGKTNVVLMLGPAVQDNEIKNNLKTYLSEQVYNLDPGDLTDDILTSQGDIISRALYDIGQLKSDNYLEITVTDERKTRAKGPYDRLNEEGAFEVLRVGTTDTGSNLDASFFYESFPRDIVTLQRTEVDNESLAFGEGQGTFLGNVLTVAKTPVTKLNSVIFQYADGYQREYPIDQYGYQLKSNRYDRFVASSFALLEDNQISLNEDIFSDPDFPQLKGGDVVLVSYEYKDLGRFVDEESVTVTQVRESKREFVPAIVNVFTLQNGPVVTKNDNIPTEGGVQFIDPNAYPPCSKPHPAFVREIPFRLSSLPQAAGEYSVDYENGTVYVWGAGENDGTGFYPPVATYFYRKTYASRLDYTYNPETLELAANPLRDLIGEDASINFSFENVLVPGVDYVAQIHKEELNERIENRLLSINSLGVKNTPITNVFRIYNETSGELYTLNRFTDNRVYFSFGTPPRIVEVTAENVSFEDVLSEPLIINKDFLNNSNVRIFEIFLNNNQIGAITQDAIGNSYNSSVTFTDTEVFQQELYLDTQTPDDNDNFNRLSVGQYQVDYTRGIIYVAVTQDQDEDIGFTNYKSTNIQTDSDHIISVSEVFYRLSEFRGLNKIINYRDFSDTLVFPLDLPITDERFLNGDEMLPYIVENGQIRVTDDVGLVRGVYDLFDLSNNDVPTNFAVGSTFSDNIISLGGVGVEKKERKTIEAGNEINATFITNGAEIISVNKVIRISDGENLWSNPGTFSDYQIILSGSGSPVPGQEVEIIYNVQLNGAATPLVDYSRGEFKINYSYLADEILVSYEHGDNVIDFTESETLEEGDTYFVTYKAGALRDALLKNFGTLVDIPIMNTFDTSFDREIYRDALQGALQSFTKGPTIPAMKLLVSSITKIDPEIIEGIFNKWTLGTSVLCNNSVKTTGDVAVVPAKFGSGVLVDKPDETITIPVTSSLRTEEGSMSMWVIPRWNGLDNDATLTFSSVQKDGYLLPASDIYIGASSFNPTFDLNGNFVVNRFSKPSAEGLPSAIYTKSGIFIYYDVDNQRWNVLAKDNPVNNTKYSGKITSSGEFYDVKFIEGFGEINDVLRSTSTDIDFEFNIDSNDNPADGYVPNNSFDGITFMADNEHYFFDFGKGEGEDRFSLYKDGSGYLNFEVWDKGCRDRRSSYKVSADISNWVAGENHFIGLSWVLGSKIQKDEMHLFVDGFEVANIIKYGGRPAGTENDRFRQVVPEIIVGAVTKKAINGDDLVTNLGSNIVFSNSINFQSEGIIAGDAVDIMESGLGSFTILTVNGNTLELDQPAGASYEDARFSVNKFSVVVESDINLYTNIAVSKITTSGQEIELAGQRATLPDYSIDKNALNQDVLTILGDVDPGDTIVIRTLGLNFRSVDEEVYLWSDSNVLKTQLPTPVSLNEVEIIPVMSQLTSIGPSNSTLAGGVFTSDPIVPSGQPSNATEGRNISVRVTGDNTDFSNPVKVTINGTAFSGAVTETIEFTEPEVKESAEKWQTIDDFVVEVTPYDDTIDATAFEAEESFSVTESNGNENFAVIKYSIPMQLGTTLSGGGSTTVTNGGAGFPCGEDLVGKNLTITYPDTAAGSYKVLSATTTELELDQAVPGPAFNDGVFGIYNTPMGRSGFANGIFTLEIAAQPGAPFFLSQGYYKVNYSSFLSVKLSPFNDINAYIGSDFEGNKQANSVIDEFKILNIQETDTRVGESVGVGEDSFTTEFLTIRKFIPNKNTLVYLDFDEKPFKNEAEKFTSFSKDFIQSSNSVNSDFNQSVVLNQKPLSFDNAGLFIPREQGTIEFWVSPQLDTYNDPYDRYYFDSASSSVEEVVSISSTTVKIGMKASSVNSVRLASDTQGQGADYFIDGKLLNDFQTIELGQALPATKTNVVVSYVPRNFSGNRISILKDKNGYLTFRVIADNGRTYEVSQPIFWNKNEWHRVRASFEFNSKFNTDQMKLFVDGNLNSVILYGSGIIYGTGFVYGQNSCGPEGAQIRTDINFTDILNKINIGSDYLGLNTAFARIDDFKISNVIQPTVLIGQYEKDPHFIENRSLACPSAPDAFTTFLMDFDTLVTRVSDFAVVRDTDGGIFNFTINVLDQFMIVDSNDRAKQVLEELIFRLKPAESKVNINYIV